MGLITGANFDNKLNLYFFCYLSTFIRAAVTSVRAIMFARTLPITISINDIAASFAQLRLTGINAILIVVVTRALSWL